MKNFVSNYKGNLVSLIQKVDHVIIKNVVDAFEDTYKKNGKVYIIGNGGSAATASHMVNDLGVGLSRRGIRYFNLESLSDNSAVCSALANDIGYEHVFSMQLKNKINKNDLLIAISCSGNSQNIINAVDYAKEQKTKIIGLTGFDGGKLKRLSDINFHIETEKNEYGLVEDLHMIFDHMIYTYYIENHNKVI